MSYNGYPSQEAFHQALRERAPAYIAERERKLAENPEGFRHEGCDHAYGICMAVGG